MAGIPRLRIRIATPLQLTGTRRISTLRLPSVPQSTTANIPKFMQAMHALGRTFPGITNYTFGMMPKDERAPVALEDMSIVEMRAYQAQQVAEIIAAMRAGRDRVYVRAPWQTGKSRMIPTIAREAAVLFPQKKVLVITPFKVVFDQAVDDAEAQLPRNVAQINADQKDFDTHRQFVVASAHTLVRHLDKLNPNEYGLVIVDEATFSLAGTWQKIYRHLGFLDQKNNIRTAPGKFLLGLTADGFSLRSVFGPDAVISSPGLHWFMEKGHLHRVTGVRLKFRDITAPAVYTEGAEHIAAPAQGSRHYIDDAIAVYRQRFPGQKVIINVASIGHANEVEAGFNAKFGAGYAFAAHSDRSDDVIRDQLKAYSNGTGPKVIINIWKLSYAFRAKGTSGVMNLYETDSLRRYGQRVGRALGMIDGEAQRTVTVVDFRNQKRHVNNPASLPRLFGVLGYFDDGVDFNPLTIPKNLAQASENQSGVIRNKTGLFQFVGEAVADLVVQPKALRRFLQLPLVERYQRDVAAMAEDLGMDIDQLDKYLYGELPRNAVTVRQMAKVLKIPETLMVNAWLSDGMMIMDGLYPLPKNSDPRVRELVQLVRKAIMVLGNGSRASAYRNAHFSRDQVRGTDDLFKGEVPTSVESWKDIAQLIDAAHLETPAYVRQLMKACGSEAAKSAAAASAPHRPVGGLNELDARVGLDDVTATTLASAFELFAELSGIVENERKILDVAMHYLTSRQQKVLDLWMDDLTHSEIGQEVGVSGGRSNQIWTKGLMELREKMVEIQREGIPREARYPAPEKAPVVSQPLAPKVVALDVVQAPLDVSQLVTQLRYLREQVRDHRVMDIIRSLGEMGPAAKVAVPELQLARADRNHSVQIAAQLALQSIAGDSAAMQRMPQRSLHAARVATDGVPPQKLRYPSAKTEAEKENERKREKGREKVNTQAKKLWAIVNGSENSQQRLVAVEALAQLKDKSVLPALRGMIETDTVQLLLRREAAMAYGRIDGETQGDILALIEMARSMDFDERLEAVRLLGEKGPAAWLAVPELVQAMRHDSIDEVKVEAQKALNAIKAFTLTPQ